MLRDDRPGPSSGRLNLRRRSMASQHVAARALIAAWLMYVHASWISLLGGTSSAPHGSHRQQHLTSGAPDPEDSAAWASALLDEAVGLLRSHPEAMDPEHGGSYGPDARLAFLKARTALQLAPGDHTAARLTALLAEASYPYFFSWPESQRALSGAMGADAVATHASRIQQRHSARWAHWRRPVPPPAPLVAPLPPPSLAVTPFRTSVLVWDLPAAKPGPCTLYSRE